MISFIITLIILGVYCILVSYVFKVISETDTKKYFLRIKYCLLIQNIMMTWVKAQIKNVRTIAYEFILRLANRIVVILVLLLRLAS